MREFLSVDREANAIRLRRSTFPGTFLLVEGYSDKLVYERFIDKVQCQIVVVSGKPSSKLRVIAVVEVLENSAFQGILGIIDADFDRLEAALHPSPNLLHTDTHDLETMLLNSFALEKVLAEFGSEEKIRNWGRDVRTTLLQVATSVGYLRWISKCDELNLTFEGIVFSKFIDQQTLQIDESALIQQVRNRSQAFSIQQDTLQQSLTSVKDDSHDLWQICCGHDLAEILSVGLRRALGTQQAADVEIERLKRSLRLAYEETYFKKTQLHTDICTWEIHNSPFKVLRSEIAA